MTGGKRIKDEKEDLQALENVLREVKEGCPFVVDAYLTTEGLPVIEIDLEKAFQMYFWKKLKEKAN